jgi:uncharacterized protein with FMN-binding domain
MAEKMPRRLVLLSSAAIGAIYAVGYVATRNADSTIAAAAPATTAAPTAQPAVQSVPQVPVNAGIAVAQAPAGAIQAPAAATATTTPPVTIQQAAPGTVTAAPTARATAVPATATAVPRTVYVAPKATATAAPVAGSASAATSQYKDGTYSAWGTSRRGNVQTAVTIAGGKIARVTITSTTTQYPESWIAQLPSEVMAAQSTNISLVSGATLSSMAFRNAVDGALQQAQNG